jgi:adenylosuccinate lyase
MSREEAYAIVQRCTHAAWNKPDGNFRALISQEPKVKELLSEVELERCFDAQQHTKHLELIYQRLGI